MGRDDLSGVRVAVQGAGAVGADLARQLGQEGADVLIADVDPARAQAAAAAAGGQVVGVEDVLFADVDVLAPCALGAILNDTTIPALRTKIVCGAANNQLAVESIHGEILRERGIAYAPDFLINAGGIINVYGEIAKYDKAEAMRRTENIYNTTLEIFNFADSNNITTQFAAMQIAQNRIDQRKKENTNK
jgi:leucine dehydrogenase